MVEKQYNELIVKSFSSGLSEFTVVGFIMMAVKGK